MWLFTKSDAQLLKEISEGQNEAFCSLYEKYKADVYGLARRMMGQQSLADETTQDVWMKVIDKAATFQIDKTTSAQGSKDASAKAWLMTMTKNHCLNQIKRRRFEQPVENEEIFEQSSEEATAQDQMILECEARQVKLVLDQLPDRQRHVLVLFYYEEKSLLELSQELELEVNAVKALLHRGRQSLLKGLKGKIDE